MAKKPDQREELIAAQQATIAQLTALVADLKAMLEKAQLDSAALNAKLDLLTRKMFGKSSEKMPTPSTVLAKTRDPQAKADSAKAKRRANEEKKAQLEPESVRHSVAADERVCPACASTVRATESWPRIPRHRDHRAQTIVIARSTAS